MKGLCKCESSELESSYESVNATGKARSVRTR